MATTPTSSTTSVAYTSTTSLAGVPPSRTSEERVQLQAKLLSLEIRWAKLQWECEGRNMRLQTIHTLLTGYDRAVVPFMVRILFCCFSFYWLCCAKYAKVTSRLVRAFGIRYGKQPLCCLASRL